MGSSGPHIILNQKLEKKLHNSVPHHWNIPEKIQTGGLRTYFFVKIPGIFRFVTLP